MLGIYFSLLLVKSTHTLHTRCYPEFKQSYIHEKGKQQRQQDDNEDLEADRHF